MKRYFKNLLLKLGFPRQVKKAQILERATEQEVIDKADAIMRDFHIRDRQIQLEVTQPLTRRERQMFFLGYKLGVGDVMCKKGTDISIKDMIEKGILDPTKWLK